MNIRIVLPVMLLALTPLVIAQTNLDVPRKPSKPATNDTSEMPDGILKFNGVVYILKNGVHTRIERDAIMRVSPDGTVTNFDGSTWVVPDGQAIGLNGTTVEVPGTILDTRAVEQAAQGPSDRGRNFSGLAPVPKGAAGPPLPDRGATSAAPGQTPSVGRSGSAGDRNRNQGAGTILDIGGLNTVAPIVTDPNLTTNAFQGPNPNLQNTQTAPKTNTTTGTGAQAPNTTTTNSPNARPAASGTQTGTATGTGTGTGATRSGTGTTSGGTGTGTSGGAAGGSAPR